MLGRNLEEKVIKERRGQRAVPPGIVETRRL